MKDCALWAVRPTTGATRDAKRKDKEVIEITEVV